MIDFDRDGWRLESDVMTPAACYSLLAAIDSATADITAKDDTAGVDMRRSGGVRGLFFIPAIVALVRSPAIRELIEPLNLKTASAAHLRRCTMLEMA